MSKFIYCDGEYKIIQNNKDFTLINLKGNYENHGHFFKNSTCFMLIRLMRKQVVPKSKYLQDAILRISTNESYKTKILNKQDKLRNKMQYYNSNKGVR